MISSLVFRRPGIDNTSLSFEKGKTFLSFLTEVGSEMNSLFSFPIFVILTTTFISAIVNLYLFISTFLKENVFLSNIQTGTGVFFSLNAIGVSLLLFSAEIPIKEVCQLKSYQTLYAMLLDFSLQLKRQKEILMKWLPYRSSDPCKVMNPVLHSTSPIEDIKVSLYELL